MPELLKIDNLTVAFENSSGEMTAVKGVSLDLDAGETLALVGESGCGKTVLCKSMLKILCDKGRVRQGEILFGGRDLIPVSEREMAELRGSDIAMIFQDPMMSLDPSFSVGEQITEVLRIHKGLSKQAAKARAIELMGLVKISDAALRYGQRPYQFSGGMRQRIAIAIALAGEPKLLLADEPTTALDDETQQEILQLLKAIQQQTQVAVLFITHDLSLVENIAQRVAIMKDGHVVEQGYVKEVFAAPQHQYTKKLLGYLDYKKGKGHNHKAASSYGIDGKNDIALSSDTAKMSMRRAEARSTGGMECCDNRKGGENGESREIHECSTGKILEIKKLCKSFSVDKKNINSVLRDFDLDIYAGEIVGLVGRSGCGKSTLARCIMKIEKPDSGHIDIKDGIKTQMIFQDSQSAFNDRMTVEQIIAEPLQINKRRRRSKTIVTAAEAMKELDIMMPPDKPHRVMGYHEAVMSVMRSVELDTELAYRKPYELSGGQRQRVAIARALITNPDFIIADEPLTGLDVSAQAQIVHLLKKLADEQGLTILFIAHDIPMVNHISDRVIKMG